MMLFALRGSTIGNDTHEYIRIFNEISTQGDSKFEFGRYETGFIYLNYLLKSWHDDAQIIFVVAGLFIYYSFGRFILKYSKMPWLSLFLFFTYGLFTFTFTALRQGMAMAICLFAFEALMKGKNIRFVLIVIFATFFHSTAIVFLLASLCKFLKPNGKTFVLSYISAAVLLIAFTAVLNYIFQMLPMYEHYTSGSYIGEMGIAAFLYSFLSSVILFFTYSVVKKTKSLSRIDAYGMIMILLAVILYIVSIKANIFDRMAIYFNMFAIIILPNAINLLKGQKQLLAITTSIIVFFAYQAIIISYRPEWISIYPYSFYWQK